MRMKLLALLIPAALMLVALVPRVAYADVSVRVLPSQIVDSKSCGVTFVGRCEQAIWCDDWYAPITVPYGDAVATFSCGGMFGQVFRWNATGYGTAQAFELIGPGGPIKVSVWEQWGEFGVEAVEFRVHNLTMADLYPFLSDWFAGAADFNNSGATTAQDIFDFLAACSGPP